MFEDENRNEIIQKRLDNSFSVLVLDTNVLLDEHINNKVYGNGESSIVLFKNSNSEWIKKGVTILLPQPLLNRISDEIDNILTSNSRQTIKNYLKDIGYKKYFPFDDEDRKAVLLKHIKNKIIKGVKDGMYKEEYFGISNIGLKEQKNGAGGYSNAPLATKSFKNLCILDYKNYPNVDYVSLDGMDISKNHNYSHEIVHLGQNFDEEKEWYQFTKEKEHLTIKNDSLRSDLNKIAIEIHAEISSYLLDLNSKIKKLKGKDGKVDEVELRKYLIKMFVPILTRQTANTTTRHNGYNETANIFKSFLKDMSKEDLLNFGEKSVTEIQEISDNLTLERLKKLVEPNEKKNKIVAEIDKDFADTQPSRIDLYYKMSENNEIHNAIINADYSEHKVNEVIEIITKLNLGSSEKYTPEINITKARNILSEIDITKTENILSENNYKEVENYSEAWNYYVKHSENFAELMERGRLYFEKKSKISQIRSGLKTEITKKTLDNLIKPKTTTHTAQVTEKKANKPQFKEK
ncbi:MAG: hypothetical protein Ta2D_03020 [Rickettsiales bacterium]|nr:MAG: hypothetical protein Ta2D_03020 [Rickettsiales bacterium]